MMSRINDHVAEVADALWYCFYAYTPTQLRANNIRVVRTIDTYYNSYEMTFVGHVNKKTCEVDYVTVSTSYWEDKFCKVYKPKTYAALQETAFSCLSHFCIP